MVHRRFYTQVCFHACIGIARRFPQGTEWMVTTSKEVQRLPKPNKDSVYFSKVLGPNLQFYLFRLGSLCPRRAGFFSPRRSKRWAPGGFVCALPNTNATVLNALRPAPERYKGASLSLKSGLIRVTSATLNLPLSNHLSYCYNLSFFQGGSLEAFHILVKCSWSQSPLRVPLIMSLLWCKIELLLQCVLYPGKAKPFPTVNSSGRPQK